MGRYTEHLVCSEQFQDAIRRLVPGTPITLTPEPRNPSDPRAIAAILKEVGTIGYVESAWLKATMLDDGTPVASRVAEIVLGDAPQIRTVVLEVRTGEDAVAALKGTGDRGGTAEPVANATTRKRSGCGTFALVGIAVVIVGLAIFGSLLPKPQPRQVDELNSAASKSVGVNTGADIPSRKERKNKEDEAGNKTAADSDASAPPLHSNSGRSWFDPMRGITTKVAADAVDQYNIAAREGDRMQICVQAGMVSAAYLQAQDEANYRAWKKTEKSACARAGMPR